MARESISKIAYKTLQQSKSIAGFAHKQISSRIMNFILPDSKLENFDIDKNLLQQIQNSMDLLREEDWNSISIQSFQLQAQSMQSLLLEIFIIGLDQIWIKFSLILMLP